MEYLEKASLYQKKKKWSIVTVTIVATIVLAGFLLCAYNILVANYLYSLLYLLSGILGLGYVIIRINAIMPAYIAASAEHITIQCWRNGVFPYRVGFRFSFLADFIPDRVVKTEIAIREIQGVYIGGRLFLSRTLSDEAFEAQLDELSSYRRGEKELIRKMDFLCIQTKDNQLFYIPIIAMDSDELARVVNVIHRKNEEAEIKCNIKDIRSNLTIE